MANFVLVHGAFHGGWCYSRVAAILRAAGHEVFTPTLTGCGERVHLCGQAINLSTHVHDIVNLFHYEGLEDVILCGHSYGGMVITAVAAAVGEKIRALFYLDAIVPEHGQCLFDVVGREIMIGTLASAATTGGWVPPLSASFMGVNSRDAAWVDSLCTPHPIATFLQKIELTGKEALVRNRTYMLADAFNLAANHSRFTQLREDPAWKTVTVNCGHDIMIDEPAALALCLLEEVSR